MFQVMKPTQNVLLMKSLIGLWNIFFMMYCYRKRKSRDKSKEKSGDKCKDRDNSSYDLTINLAVILVELHMNNNLLDWISKNDESIQ